MTASTQDATDAPSTIWRYRRQRCSRLAQPTPHALRAKDCQYGPISRAPTPGVPTHTRGLGARTVNSQHYTCSTARGGTAAAVHAPGQHLQPPASLEQEPQCPDADNGGHDPELKPCGQELQALIARERDPNGVARGIASVRHCDGAENAAAGRRRRAAVGHTDVYGGDDGNPFLKYECISCSLETRYHDVGARGAQRIQYGVGCAARGIRR